MRRAVLSVGGAAFVGLVVACSGAGGRKPAADPGAVLEVTRENAGELVDHPDRFKGRTLVADCVVRAASDQLNDGQTLRDLAGKAVTFHGFYGNTGVAFRADVPADPAALPAAKYNDGLRVTFVCGEGSLARGNRAVRVERR